MPQVSSGDVQKNFGEYRMVAEEEPVHVSHYNKPSVVIVSAEECARLKKRAKQAMATEDLPEWLVEQIANSEMDAKYNYLDENADHPAASTEPWLSGSIRSSPLKERQ